MAVITLNRPEVMNALNAAMRAELAQAIARAGSQARVVVLTGSGRAFCSGQDLGDAGAIRADSIGDILRDEYEPMLAAITDCPVPVLAAVNGVAAGAGASLALAADMVIAAESASFIQAFARIGLMPDAGGTWVLPRLVGRARALGAMMLADPVSARQAADWGMIWQAVPDADFLAQWRDTAGRLAAGPTLAYAAMRAAVRASSSNDLAAQLRLEAGLQARCGATEDFAEGLSAFRDRRAATFSGR